MKTAVQEFRTAMQSISGSDAATTPPTEPTEASNIDILFKEMENIIVERRIRSEPPLQPLWDTAVRRRQEAAQGEASAAALARSPSADHSEPELKSEPDAPTAWSSSIPAVAAVEANGAGHSSELEELHNDGGVLDPSTQSSSSKTVLVDEGPRRRTTSTRSFIRVTPRPPNDTSEEQEDQVDED